MQSSAFRPLLAKGARPTACCCSGKLSLPCGSPRSQDPAVSQRRPHQNLSLPPSAHAVRTTLLPSTPMSHLLLPRRAQRAGAAEHVVQTQRRGLAGRGLGGDLGEAGHVCSAEGIWAGGRKRLCFPHVAGIALGCWNRAALPSSCEMHAPRPYAHPCKPCTHIPCRTGQHSTGINQTCGGTHVCGQSGRF